MTGAPARLGGPATGCGSRLRGRAEPSVKNGYSTMLSGLRLGLMVTGEGRSGPPRTGHPRLDFVAVSSHPARGLDTPPAPGEVLLNPLRSRRCCPTSQLAVCSRPTVVKVAAGVRYAACRGRSVRDYCAVLPPLSRMICPVMTLTPRTRTGRRRRSSGVLRPAGEGCCAGMSALSSSAP